MSDKLQIYACNGLEDGKRLKFQSEGTNAATNTQAMNSLLIRMNLLRTEVLCVPMSADERVAKLKELDLYSVAFYYARLYHGKREELMEAGNAIAMLIDGGSFALDSEDMAAHEEYVEQLIGSIDDMINSGTVKVMETEFMDWWTETVVNRDVVGLQNVEGVGAPVINDYGELNDYLYNAGTYFLYLYTPKSREGDLTPRMSERLAKQQEVYDYCRKCFCYEYGGIYGDESDLQDAIRASIVADFGAQPEEVINDILDGKRKAVNGVGLADVVIAAIISAVTSLVIAIIGAVVSYAQRVTVAKYTVPSDVEDGMANPDDWAGLNKGVDIKTFGLGAVAIAAVLFLLNSNDKK